MQIRNWFEWFFCLRSNLSDDNIIPALRPGLKTGIDFRVLVWKGVWKNKFLGLKSGQDLKNWEAYPYQEFPGVPPRLFVLHEKKSFYFLSLNSYFQRLTKTTNLQSNTKEENKQKQIIK